MPPFQLCEAHSETYLLTLSDRGVDFIHVNDYTFRNVATYQLEATVCGGAVLGCHERRL